jgi:hypothetical protein
MEEETPSRTRDSKILSRESRPVKTKEISN